jgi:hypothetical protein
MALPTPTHGQRLSQLPRELKRRYGRTPDYRILWRFAIEGRFPAHQINGRWHYFEPDVPEISASLGLTVEPSDDLQAAEQAPALRQIGGTS